MKNVSFSLQPGELTGVLGPNGAGKTTLFNLLTGFIAADTGAHPCSRDRNLRDRRRTRSSSCGVARAPFS